MIEIEFKCPTVHYLYHETAKFDFINKKFYLKLPINMASKLKETNLLKKQVKMGVFFYELKHLL